MDKKSTKLKRFFRQIFAKKASNKAGLFKKAVVGSLLLGSVGIIAGSTYTITQKLTMGGDYVPGYSGRIQFNPFAKGLNTNDLNNNTNFGKFNLQGKEYDFDEPKVLDQAISQAAKALNDYNVSLGRANFSVNYSNVDATSNNSATRLLNLNFRAESFPKVTIKNDLDEDVSIDYNQNKAWFDLVHLNQLSIDRFGINYSPNGSQVLTTSPTLQEIVSFNDVGADHMQLFDRSNDPFRGLSFNIYSKNIAPEQMRVLAGENETHYVIPDQAKNNGASNNWYVWLDKDILAIKLFYIYQTYVFHDTRAFPYNAIEQAIGNPSTKSQNALQLEHWKVIQENYKALSDDEKKFAATYITTFHPSVGLNWVDVVNDATDFNKFAPNRLNEIYNRMKANNSDATALNVFKNHLIAQITPGTAGNWKNFFPKYNSVLNKDYQEVIDPTKPEEINGLFALNNKQEVITKPKSDTNSTNTNNGDSSSNNNNSSESSGDADKKITEYKPSENVIHLAVDSALAPNISNQQLFERLTKYQVKFLQLRRYALVQTTQSALQLVPIWSSSVYSTLPSGNVKNLTNSVNLMSNYTAIRLNFEPALSGSIPNPLSHINDWLWYLIAFLILILAVGIIVAILYRIPGLIGFVHWLASLAATFAAFFALNLQLTTDATVGIVATVIVTLMTLFYSLNHISVQVRRGSSLKQASLISMRYSSVFNLDVYIVIFFTAIIFAFISALELRGFGLMLSIGAFMGMFVYGILSVINNYLVVDLYAHKPSLFLFRKYQVFLKSLSGQIENQSDLAKKIVSRKYRPKLSTEFGNSLAFSLLNWKAAIYFVLIALVLIVGIILIFIPSVGFGSSFILKSGTLITYRINEQTTLLGTQESIQNALTALNPNTIAKDLNVNLTQDVLANSGHTFFLRTTDFVDAVKLTTLFNKWLQPNSYNIEDTTSFAGQAIINSAFIYITVSLIIMSVYFVIRFNWMSLFQIWLSTFFLIGFSLAFITIIRITVDHNITGGILLIYVISLISNIWFLSVYRLNYRKWHFYDKKEFTKIINQAVNNYTTAYFSFFGLVIFLGALGIGFNWLQVEYLFVYLIIGLIAAVLTLAPITTFMWIISMMLRQKIFYHSHYNSQNEQVLTMKYRVKNHDKVDEQLIPNINYFQ